MRIDKNDPDATIISRIYPEIEAERQEWISNLMSSRASCPTNSNTSKITRIGTYIRSVS